MVGAPSTVRGLRAHRVLRRLFGTSRLGALAGNRSPDHPLVRARRELVLELQTNEYYDGPELAAPDSRPKDQTVPGPQAGCPTTGRTNCVVATARNESDHFWTTADGASPCRHGRSRAEGDHTQ